MPALPGQHVQRGRHRRLRLPVPPGLLLRLHRRPVRLRPVPRGVLEQHRRLPGLPRRLRQPQSRRAVCFLLRPVQPGLHSFLRRIGLHPVPGRSLHHRLRPRLLPQLQRGPLRGPTGDFVWNVLPGPLLVVHEFHVLLLFHRNVFHRITTVDLFSLHRRVLLQFHGVHAVPVRLLLRESLFRLFRLPSQQHRPGPDRRLRLRVQPGLLPVLSHARRGRRRERPRRHLQAARVCGRRGRLRALHPDFTLDLLRHHISRAVHVAAGHVHSQLRLHATDRRLHDQRLVLRGPQPNLFPVPALRRGHLQCKPVHLCRLPGGLYLLNRQFHLPRLRPGHHRARPGHPRLLPVRRRLLRHRHPNPLRPVRPGPLRSRFYYFMPRVPGQHVFLRRSPGLRALPVLLHQPRRRDAHRLPVRGRLPPPINPVLRLLPVRRRHLLPCQRDRLRRLRPRFLLPLRRDHLRHLPRRLLPGPPSLRQLRALPPGLSRRRG